MIKQYITKRFISSKEYQELLKCFLGFCTRIEFSIEDQLDYGALNPLSSYLVSSKLKDKKQILVYTYDESTYEIIIKLTDNIYGWHDPNLPSNLTLLRDDNSIFLSYYGDMEVVIDLRIDEIPPIDNNFPSLFEEVATIAPNIHSDVNKIKINDGIRSKKFDYLPNNFVAMVKNYVNLIEEVENEIISKYLVNNYDFISKLGLKKEIEIEESLIQNSSLSHEQKEELNLVKSELKQIDNHFTKFISSNINQSLVYVKAVLDSFIKYYPNIISVSTAPNKDYWSFYLSNFQEVRADISVIISLVNNLHDEEISLKVKEIKRYDEDLISNLGLNHFLVVHNKSERLPKSQWWYHLHEIEKLSKHDLETI